MTTAAQRAGIYCRLSLAKLGDTTKVEDQQRISRELSGRLGWQVASGIGYPHPDGVYTDNNRSAWLRNRKRPGWDAMLADVEAGRLDAIVVYHGDRLVRQPWDLELLLNLAYGKGIRLASPTGTRDLANDDDLFILRIEVAAQCRESSATSRRQKAQYARRRQAGLMRPGGQGGRMFGFASDALTHVDAEAELVREAAGRVLAGESSRAIAASLSARGVRTTAGNPVTPIVLRRMLARPQYAGLMPGGERKGAWEPILDQETWEAVQSVLGARGARYTYGSGGRRYLLTGIAACGAPDGDGQCGSPMQIRQQKDRRHDGYGCVRRGCMKAYRSVALLDAYVTGHVVARLNLPDNPAGRVPARPGHAAEFRQLQEDRAETEAALRDPAKGKRVGLLSDRLDAIDARLAQLRELSGSDARSRLLDAHRGITEKEFKALPLETRRALVTACVTIVVLPASRRGAGFVPDDVILTPR